MSKQSILGLACVLCLWAPLPAQELRYISVTPESIVLRWDEDIRPIFARPNAPSPFLYIANLGDNTQNMEAIKWPYIDEDGAHPLRYGALVRPTCYDPILFPCDDYGWEEDPDNTKPFPVIYDPVSFELTLPGVRDNALFFLPDRQFRAPYEFIHAPEPSALLSACAVLGTMLIVRLFRRRESTIQQY